MKRLLLGLLLCAFIAESSATNLRFILRANPDGSYSTAYPCVLADRSDCAPPSLPTLSCNDSAAPSLNGQTVSTSYSENVRSYYSGTAAASCTLSLNTVSGSDAAATGWGISTPNLTISSATPGSGALKVGCTTGGNTTYCSTRSWSRVPTSSDGGVAPSIPTGLAYTAGSGSVTISGDCPSDPPPTASLLKQVNLRFNQTGATTAVTSCGAGLSRTLTQAIIGASDGTPSSSQSGTGISLSFGGSGWDSTADNFLFFRDSTGISGNASASASYSVLSSSASFAKATIMARESDAVGAKFVSCTLQKNGKLQMRYRATDNATSVSALNQNLTLVGSAFNLVRSGDNWTCEGSTTGGTTWDSAGATTAVSMIPTLNWGLAITSTSAGTNATANLLNWNLNNVGTTNRWSYVKSTSSPINVEASAQDNDNNISSYSGVFQAIPNVSVTALRWRPGHYARMAPGDSAATINSRVQGFCSNTAVRGIVVLPYWKDFETAKGSYSWTFFDSVMAQAAACNKAVIVRIQDRKFNTSAPLGAVPQYIYDEHLTYVRANSRGAGAAIWRKEAMDYLTAGYLAILSHFSGNTTLAALGGEESVIGGGTLTDGNGGATITDYSAAQQLDQELRRATTLRTADKAVPYILYTNFFTSSPGASSATVMANWFAQASLDPGIILNGGPDCICDSGGAISGQSTTGFDVWNGTVSAGAPNYLTGYAYLGSTEYADWDRGATPASVYSKLVTTFGAHYMSWVFQNSASQTWNSNILPFINSHAIPNTSCPARIAAAQGCDTPGGGGALTYTPYYTRDFQSGTNGSNISNFSQASASHPVKYSNAVTGPFGEALVAKIGGNTGGFNAFGGSLTDWSTLSRATLLGGDTWIRIYHYFPSGWCAGYNSPGSGDGYGATKWLRLGFNSDAARMTFQLGGFSSNACSSGSASPFFDYVSTEGMPDASGGLFYYWNGSNHSTASDPNLKIARDGWHAIQWHIKWGALTSTSDIEGWIDSTYLGKATKNSATLPNGSTGWDDLEIGNYWNGQFYQTTDWYISDIIVTNQTPNTLDSGGRPYIAPTTKIADFP